MAYEYITNYDSPNFGYPRGTRGQNKPEEIIIHHWGADGQNFWGVVNWLCRNGGSSSAHYVIEAGRAACLVDWNDSAWHAGDYYVNNHSIGLECRPEMSEADFDTVAEVISDIWRVYGKLPLRGHKDIAATACPGRWYVKLNELYNRAEAYYSSGKKEATPKNPKRQKITKTVDELAREVLQGNWGNGNARKENLVSAGYDYNAVQERVNQLCGVEAVTLNKTDKTIEELAKEVLRGDWGNGSDRAARLSSAGYDYQAVQSKVNELCGSRNNTVNKSIEELANEVIHGDWGNGDERRNRLTAAGYDYNAVQAEVNRRYS